MLNYYNSSNVFLSTMRSTKNLSDKTITAYHSDLIDFCRYIGDSDIAEDTILNYVGCLSKKKLKDSTINRKLIVLKMFFEYLYHNHYIDQNYYLSHKFKFKKERKLPKTLTVNEVSRLIDYLTEQEENASTVFSKWKSTRNLALIDILISTGIRVA